MIDVVSVSLGSSRGDYEVDLVLGRQHLTLRRIGVDGDWAAAERVIRQLDGEVGAIGIGGTDLAFTIGGSVYPVRRSSALADAARQTPVVDGTGWRTVFEASIFDHFRADEVRRWRCGFVPIGAARFALAGAVEGRVQRVRFGDVYFATGLPIALRSTRSIRRLAPVVLPMALRVAARPRHVSTRPGSRRSPRRWWESADLIAGDSGYIRHHAPSLAEGVTVITNSTSREDRSRLYERGASTVVTTTPHVAGRSLSTNLAEAVVVAACKVAAPLPAAAMRQVAAELGFLPRVDVGD